MARLIILFLITLSFLKADIYEENCVTCHKQLPVSIDKFFYRYLLKYSSEKAVKFALFEYLKEPSKETTVMPEAFILRFDIKKPTTLDDKQLKQALDIYWDKYKVFGKLK
ncbi:hypothetical protein [Malaciobacter mytili]|uniref:Cytochrome c domain-containing protein n=1 Tax=Malaciobacter mytili LMG 24559 TaxID=1032238 RepID=A0AAX2AHD9_9BACT|nr:hypothetical protein [Malaciobacter mytili]AXH15238.1 hypothetical protein AMYT_1664 [Malaciobacter mytili LMG 24559]RXK15570.1 hypothetical protein CP985_07915 [Malaciobacter mytili LMG 24559]